MSMFDLKFDEPIDAWLNSDSATGTSAKASEVLSSHSITVVEEYGGTGLGPWANGSHESGFVIQTDLSTATAMAVLIEETIGYPVVVTEVKDYL